MAFEIPEIVYAFGPQLKAFMEVGILLTYFAVSYSSLSEDSAEFRYRRFHGRGRHLGSGANPAKFTVNVWEKS